MAVKAYKAKVKNADGTIDDISFDHVNFNGDIPAARKLFEKHHTGSQVLEIEELGYRSPADVKKLAEELNTGVALTEPAAVVHPDAPAPIATQIV